eukprot:98459-Prymnesium_polylepis.1
MPRLAHAGGRRATRRFEQPQALCASCTECRAPPSQALLGAASAAGAVATVLCGHKNRHCGRAAVHRHRVCRCATHQQEGGVQQKEHSGSHWVT